MSAFDEWFRNRDAAFATLGETCAEYAERAARDAWNAALDRMGGTSGVGAIPETGDHANGWNDCRQSMFAAYKARIAELRAKS